MYYFDYHKTTSGLYYLLLLSNNLGDFPAKTDKRISKILEVPFKDYKQTLLDIGAFVNDGEMFFRNMIEVKRAQEFLTEKYIVLLKILG